jgi:LysM repeat protein
MNAISRQIAAFIFLLGTLAVFAGASRPVVAAPLLQLTPFPTPTPGPDGRILYIVQPGDTLLRISLIAGVPLDELRGLNNLIGDDIFEGQELLLGLGGPSEVTPTPGPSPTPTPILPTPSPQPGFGTLCILLYNDRNGDALRQEEELSIPGGAISINNRTGSVSFTADTTPGDLPECFEELPEGEYNITVAVPEGYNPTTQSSYSLELNAGDETYLDFGGQVNSETIVEAPEPEQESRSPLLGIIGAVLLLAGVGVAIFAARLMRGK